jgi:hypothetical protein
VPVPWWKDRHALHVPLTLGLLAAGYIIAVTVPSIWYGCCTCAAWKRACSLSLKVAAHLLYAAYGSKLS